MPKLNPDEVLARAFSTDFKPEMAKDLRDLLSNDSAVLAYLGVLEERRLATQNSLVTVDLASDEGRLRALRMQGIIAGYKLATEVLLELANSDQTEEQDNAE